MTEAKADLLANTFEIAAASLKIDGYYVKELRVSVRNNLDEQFKLALGTGLHVQPSQVMLASPGINLELGLGEHSKDPSKFRITLLIESNEEDDASPYVFSIKLIGYFSLPEGEHFDLFYQRNAAMLLYSAAREIVASVTGRGPFPAFMLPTVTFHIPAKMWKEMHSKNRPQKKKIGAKKEPLQLPSSTASTKKKKTGKKPSSKK